MSDVVFRRINGRIVPIRRKKDDDSTAKTIGKASAAAGAAGSATYGAGEGYGRWLKRKKSWIQSAIDPLNKQRPKPYKGPSKPLNPWDHRSDRPLSGDVFSPLAKVSIADYNEKMKAWKKAQWTYSRQFPKRVWDNYRANIRPDLKNLRIERLGISRAQSVLSRNLLKASIGVGVAAGLGAVVHEIYKNSRKKK
jgi:hypothetical protein